ncbi:hypothetical protein ACVNF4_09850 [Streptomyces sp. S6]
MIRVVTAARMRRLCEDAGRARALARVVRGHAEEAWCRHILRVWELTARAESAESDAAILREQVGEFEAALKRARAELAEQAERAGRRAQELEAAAVAVPAAGSPVVVLLHWGEVHSVHASVHDAEARATRHGADPSGWGPVSALPASQVAWRTFGATVSGGGPCTP